MPPFTKVLVANRGEIAVRVMRTLRELEVETVAVYSEADRGALHPAIADEAFLLGPGPAGESYLRGDLIIEVARRAGAEAIHPGYGFLAENAAFAREVEAAGLVWIGPPADAIEAMGSKIAARARMRDAGVPVVPGTTAPAGSAADVLAAADEIGYPIAIKASAGGGGKGLRVARSADDVERAFEAAQREGEAYFADSAVYVERYLDDPRHVEVQILADGHGNVVHLGERDCTIQRRHQKLVEETPSPAVGAELRAHIGALAVEAARAVAYRSAGTIEGLLTQEGEYFFLEMNTRVQVEHTVTEAVTGIDIVREQVLVAAGEPLSIAQDDVVLRGHAIECRINAEDVTRGFLPAPGRITAYREPAGIGVRVDSGVRSGDEISGLYDPLIAKLIVHDVDREHARRRMLRALEEFVIDGPPNLLGFHRALLETPCFVSGDTCNGVVESEELARRAQELQEQSGRRSGGVATALGWARAAGQRRDRRAPPRGAHPCSRAAVGRGRTASQGAQQGHRGHCDRRGREPDAGNRALGRGGRGQRDPGGRAHLRRRGDEDGERARRAPRRRRCRAPRRAGSAGRARRRRLRDRRAMTAGRCADLSEKAGESLAATATSVDTWLLVEVRGTWPRDVSDPTALGETASARIAAWLADVPSSRLLFIRRPGPARDRRLVFVVRASEQEAHVRRLELGPADDLADVDLDAGGEVVDAQLVLVCGHGTRDACCALRGSAVFGALAADLEPDSLWLSSHQGGHRFAANVLVLPGGIHLGRVAPEDASRVVGDALVGRIPLDHYRGRTAYSAREQAAEGVVRGLKDSCRSRI